MPERSEQDERRADWLMFLMALQSGTEDFEARIKAGWRGFRSNALADAEAMRRRMMRAVDNGVRGVALQGEFYASTHDWRKKQESRLGIFVGCTIAADGVYAAGRIFNANRGGALRAVNYAHRDLMRTTNRAIRPLGNIGNKGQRRNVINKTDATRRTSGKASGKSWLENIETALEYVVHIGTASALDMTYGTNSESVLRETARKVRMPVQRMKLSYLTHQRAVYRAGLGEMGHAGNAGHWALWLPASERRKAAPTGFAAKHIYQVKTQLQWESVRRSLKAKRPGSYLFSTGFHPGDTSYLFPVFVPLAAEAREDLRQRRQEFVERVKEKAASG